MPATQAQYAAAMAAVQKIAAPLIPTLPWFEESAAQSFLASDQFKQMINAAADAVVATATVQS
jgi:hypothetical protein